MLGPRNESEFARDDEPSESCEALQRVVDSGEPYSAERAKVEIGLLLQNRGDVDGAREAYQHVIDSDHPDWAPRAAKSLADMLVDEGGQRLHSGMPG